MTGRLLMLALKDDRSYTNLMTRPRRSESTRVALISAGINQLSINGYHGTGIKKILDEVNVPKGSFYNFFASKEAYVAEVIHYYSDGLLKQLTLFIQEQGELLSPLEKLQEINNFSFKKYANNSFSHSCLIATLSTDISADNQMCRQALQASVERCLKVISALFFQAQQLNEVRDDILPQDLAEFYWTTWQGALIRMKVIKDIQAAQCTMETLLKTLSKP